MIRSRLLAIVLAAAVALPACSRSSDPASEPDASTTAACDLGPVDAGAKTLQFDGHARSYRLDLPADYDGTAPTPMLLSFHGFASDGAKQEANTAMGIKGAARGYVVVTPSSVPPQWNAFSDPQRPDDFGFVRALVADLRAQLCIDPGRIYAAGHSNGSAFVAFLVCKPPFLFAAAAMVSATTPSTCPDAVAPAVIAIAGTADPQVPYAGGSVGGSTIAIPPAAETMAAYAERYGCALTPVTDEPIPGVTRADYSDCRAGTGVEFDTIVGGTHPWPGGEQAQADPTDSKAGQQFDATSEVLDFFDRYRSTTN